MKLNCIIQFFSVQIYNWLEIQLIVPKRTNKLKIIDIKDSEKTIPWKCSKFELIGPIKKFEIFLDERWYKLHSLDNHNISEWLEKAMKDHEAMDKCAFHQPDGQWENPEEHHLQKCYSFMFTQAFPKLYKDRTGASTLPTSSTAKLFDEYNNEVTKTLSWSRINWDENERCIKEMGLHNVVHRTGFHGMLPFFGSSPMIQSRMHQHNADFERNSGEMMRQSANIFERIQQAFQSKFHHKDHIESAVGNHHHAQGAREELKKLKMEHEVDKIAYYGEQQRLKMTQGKYQSLQLIEYGLVGLILVLLQIIQAQFNSKVVLKKKKEQNQEDTLMSNF